MLLCWGGIAGFTLGGWGGGFKTSLTGGSWGGEGVITSTVRRWGGNTGVVCLGHNLKPVLKYR